MSFFGRQVTLETAHSVIDTTVVGEETYSGTNASFNPATQLCLEGRDILAWRKERIEVCAKYAISMFSFLVFILELWFFLYICHMFISLSAVRELTRSIGRWLVKTHGEDLAIGVNSLKM